MTSPAPWAEEAREFLRACPYLGKAATASDALDYVPKGSTFSVLCRSIAYQQLSGKAASTIYGRFMELFPGESAPDPAKLAEMDVETLRGVGMSRPKASYLIDLAQHVLDGRLDVAGLDALDDETVRSQITAIKGFGVWSADMHLIFGMGRPDVWPTLDLGIRKGYQAALGLPEMPKPQDMVEPAERWRPFRSAAALCCWSIANGDVEPGPA